MLRRCSTFTVGGTIGFAAASALSSLRRASCASSDDASRGFVQMRSADLESCFHGIEARHLSTLHDNVRRHLSAERSETGGSSAAAVVWLAGDSVFDNKDYVKHQRVACVNGYEKFVAPPETCPDVSHSMNSIFASGGGGNRRFVAINAAREESAIGERRRGANLNEQDIFIRDHIQPDDVLVISAGGNDCALKVNPITAASLLFLTSRFAREDKIRDGSEFGMKTMFNLLHHDMAAVLSAMCAKNVPRLIVPCFIYYPSTKIDAASWASRPLRYLGYDDADGRRRLQLLIDSLFEMCWKRYPLELDDAAVRPKIVPVALSRALDGSDGADYVQRVEPSAAGGRKIAQLVAKVIAEEY